MSTSSSPVVFNFYKIIQVWYVGYDDIVFVEGFYRLQKMYPHASKLYWSQWSWNVGHGDLLKNN